MSEVLTEVRDGILIITINRPEAKNAMSKAAAEGIAAALEQLDADNDLRVGIVTGAGGTFCSGMDLKGFLRGEVPYAPGRGFGGITQKSAAKPLIAAVDGFALAGGLEVAIACDMIVANENAKFGIPEVKRGLAAAAGGLMRLPKKIPPHIAMELALTGDFIDAKRAHELGLVNRLTSGPALDAALELAQIVAGNGPLAVKKSKQVMVESAEWSEAEMWQKQNDTLGNLFASNDAREGAAAFAEKRKPNWTGS
ncbi:crotonase/enoyl-CoA hydratase family protein [Sphingorhabdus sp.]|jgi:enoyl-CoA hydratase|uniref:crotonase/enoyl-CoA hydratase family protein n=1 Tax=Sphingorhabdus sp. TaxID=1902408 RepID=UPI003BAEA8A9|nr:crotonase/enoyl-CoA hydratase family protein [Sphingomonadales bacterium]